MSARMPLTGWDLRVIADAVDAVEATPLADCPVIGRIEVYQPDGDEVVGYVQRLDSSSPEMGWGFVQEATP